MGGEGELFWSNYLFFCIKWKDLSLVLPWETLQTTCGPMEIKCQFEYSGLTKAKLSCLWQLLKDSHNPTSCIYMYTQKTSSRTKAAAPIQDLKSDQKDVPPISMFRCYLKVFAKMATEIIILYRKVLQRDLLATFCFIKIDFIMKQCGKNSFIASHRKSFWQVWTVI